VVRVSRLSEAPTPERCLEAHHLHRTRLELIAERKVRRRLLPQGASAFLTSGHPALGQIGQDVKRH